MMAKTIAVKEGRAMYAIKIDPAQLAREPIFLEQDGKEIGVVISLDKYREFDAWQTDHLPNPMPVQFLKDRAAFQEMLPTLLKTHNGKWVAIFKGELVDSAENISELSKRVYAHWGYQAIYMDEVRAEPRVYRIPSPRLKH
jgi:hypothetical protein